MGSPRPTRKPELRKSPEIPKKAATDNFLVAPLMNVCRAIMSVKPSVKVVIYLIGVAVVSVIGDRYEVPKTIVADKYNPLNQYFVKLGWGWTLMFVGSYILLTSTVYCCRKVAKIFQHLMRLAVGTMWWCVCTTKLFVHVDETVGTCAQTEHTDKVSCLEAGGTWTGFDISGHVFLEIHCLLIILEEVRTFKEWSKLGSTLQEIRGRRSLSDADIRQSQADYKLLSPYIKIIVACLTVITLLFELMLAVSCIYRFHSVAQNVVASFVAVACWFFSYYLLFRSGNPYPFIPVMPGHSPLQLC